MAAAAEASAVAVVVVEVGIASATVDLAADLYTMIDNHLIIIRPACKTEPGFRTKCFYYFTACQHSTDIQSAVIAVVDMSVCSSVRPVRHTPVLS